VWLAVQLKAIQSNHGAIKGAAGRGVSVGVEHGGRNVMDSSVSEREKACNMHGRCVHKTVFFFFFWFCCLCWLACLLVRILFAIYVFKMAVVACMLAFIPIATSWHCVAPLALLS